MTEKEKRRYKYNLQCERTTYLMAKNAKRKFGRDYEFRKGLAGIDILLCSVFGAAALYGLSQFEGNNMGADGFFLLYAIGFLYFALDAFKDYRHINRRHQRSSSDYDRIMEDPGGKRYSRKSRVQPLPLGEPYKIKLIDDVIDVEVIKRE